ncbi:DUF4214 domain-containing protein [Acidithiobacillus sp.]|uniref:DUF4214 domain-containing protein n=1 Tax=Acidithiobacillus sp. TaxID=1872118 RepID=UPI003D0430DA
MFKKAENIAELLACEDIEFIKCAYLSILGRDPDPEGVNYYLNRLHSGVSKYEIVVQLISSDEAAAHKPEIFGLKKMVRLFKIGQIPLIGWIYRIVYGLEGNGFSHRKLRTLENKLYLLEMQNKDYFMQLERSISSLAGMVSRQTALAATVDRYWVSPATVGDPTENNFMGFYRQIPHKEDIYRELKNEIFLKNSVIKD